MKRSVSSAAVLAVASLGFAQTSYDSITGQTFPNAYTLTTGIPVASNTVLANTDPIYSIDLYLADVGDLTPTRYDLTLTIYNYAPASSNPGDAAEAVSKSVVMSENSGKIVQFDFSNPISPSETTLWTGIEETKGGSNLAVGLTNGSPTVGNTYSGLQFFIDQNWNPLNVNGIMGVRYNLFATPEPTPLAVLGFGVLGIWTSAARRRRPRKVSQK